MNTRVNERLTIEHSMRAAIRENQFYVEYGLVGVFDFDVRRWVKLLKRD